MDGIKLTGTYFFEIRDKNGVIKDAWSVKNIVTSAGKALLASLCGDAAATPFTFVAVGTGTTAVAVGDTALTAESSTNGFARAAGTVSRITTNVANDTFQITKTFTSSGSTTIQEVGVFNAASVGVILSHALTGTKVVASGDTLAITYQLVFS